jgi:hypothetical protein
MTLAPASEGTHENVARRRAVEALRSGVPSWDAVAKLHAGAFGWSPPDVAGLERLGATRMRQYVRAWINEWDLLRLDPGFSPQSVAVDIASDYRENADLEADYPSQKDSGEE